MNISHCFCAILYKRTVLEEKIRGIFAFSVFFFMFHTIRFICTQILNKFSKIPLDSAKKYTTRCYNERAKRIIMNEQID